MGVAESVRTGLDIESDDFRHPGSSGAKQDGGESAGEDGNESDEGCHEPCLKAVYALGKASPPPTAGLLLVHEYALLFHEACQRN